MRRARLLTIGTEITSGEILNSNASWMSLRIEEAGARVFSHLSVRDHRDEILAALKTVGSDDLVFVTGGLGPTSDDLTRECLAAHWRVPLDFDEGVWEELGALYRKRGLPLREAHRHQCHFPRGSDRLVNPVGTAHGFYFRAGATDFVVLPGPPREMEGMWEREVAPRLAGLVPTPSERWIRWTCIGAPESEIAEIVEPIVAGHGLEVGYRAQVPYVRIKVYADPIRHGAVVKEIERTLERFLVGRGNDDLADELLRLWPGPDFHLEDTVTGTVLALRILGVGAGGKPAVSIGLSGAMERAGLCLKPDGSGFAVEARFPWGRHRETVELPYGLSLQSERGRRSAAEWALWTCVRALRTRSESSS